jgi:catechol 2,3-dioxygenase-like lactoylglutathione lyase family enzyme
MPKNLDLKGPAFVGLKVRDVQASSDFYEKILGLRRDPQVILNGGAAFLTLPIPFGMTPAPADMDWDSIPRPILAPGIWFKAANSQVVHDALVEVGVTILKAPFDGRFGRQFTFVDPDGYAITIYDRDEPADGWSQANS